VKLTSKYVLFFLLCTLLVKAPLAQDNNESQKINLSLKNDYLNHSVLHLNNNFSFISTVSTDSLHNKKTKNPKDKKEYKIIPWRLALLGTLGAGVFTAMHIYYKDTWWKDQRRFFKFAEDGYYARNVDKVSHIYTANTFTELTAIGYEWAGISPSKSLLFGAITALAYETYIEINDGFAPIWGFDWEDMGANIFGVLYPFFQRELPVLKNFTFKWSFKPDWIKRKVSNSNDLLDDYTNMTFWLGVSPEGLLPKKAAKYYPGFLGFALGLSIKNASHTTGTKNAYREWFISLDYDVTKLPGNTEFLKKLKKILNFYHFPAPAVRVSPSGVWYGLYF
jgi:hypothetical protein